MTTPTNQPNIREICENAKYLDKDCCSQCFEIVALVAEVERLQKSVEELDGINAKRVLDYIGAICPKCGNQRDEDGDCAHCFRKVIADLTGPLAENLAHDMDRRNKDHSKWYRAVKRGRNLLKTRAQKGEQ